MKQFQYVINDPLGIHARPAGMLAKVGKTLDSKITITKDGGSKSAEVTRLIAVMGLAIKNSDTVTVTIEGGDEEASLQTMEKFFQENF
jgi:phosphocarrier protein